MQYNNGVVYLCLICSDFVERTKFHEKLIIIIIIINLQSVVGHQAC